MLKEEKKRKEKYKSTQFVTAKIYSSPLPAPDPVSEICLHWGSSHMHASLAEFVCDKMKCSSQV
jgi:hypothetical protein